MSERTRFCVLFAGTDEAQPVKTRLLYSDSTKDDILSIWKQIYDEEAPDNAELIISENCIYKLEDEDDIVAFLAQAEDQYRLLPSQPLQVTLGNSLQYFRNRNCSPQIRNDSISTPPPALPPPTTSTPLTIPKPVDPISTNTEIATDLSSKRPDANNNNNNRRCSDEEMKSSSTHSYESSPSYNHYKEFHQQSKNERCPQSWSTANSLMMLYNQYRGEGQTKIEASKSSSNPVTPTYKTVGSTIDSITGASLNKSPNLPSIENGYGRGYNNTSMDVVQKTYENPYLAYTKHLANVLSGPNPPEFSKDKDVHSGTNEKTTSLPKPSFNLSAYSAFMNNIQDQRLMQNNSSASYILQTIFNNHMKGSQKSEGSTDQSRLNVPYLDQKSSLNSAFMTPQNLLKSPNHTTPTHPFQTAKSASLLSSLAHYNNSSFLNYVNDNANRGIHNGAHIDDNLGQLSKKTLKKRKRHGLINENTKPMDSTKRMRSSVSQSNIEYHYQRAIDYSEMTEEHQKLQNSAHRSHWKHLLFVAKISPRFMVQFKHAKYDEWSSEARDIFAICQPDKYMWSFLTLSKQGDMLCKRIIGRIDGLLSKSNEERPEWCPDDERLLRAQTRARERLSQLQRILYSRSVNQEAKAAEKANELEKLSMQEKNLALVTAYHQRQQEMLQNHQAMVKHAAGFHRIQQQQQQQQQQHPQHYQAQEQHRSSNHFPTSQSARCSSLTSSPISMSSPAFEDNNSATSGCSDSPTLSSEGRHDDGNLVTAEEKELAPSPDAASEDIEVENISPLPFVNDSKVGIISPQKWIKMEQAVDM
ncbi:uncharacterized protein LOC120348096 isoform X1 [Styela clava]